MRRMIRNDDRGIATILVVLLMPVVLVFAALVFDGARGIVAIREAQNAADAAALAEALDCANALATCVSGADTTAASYKGSTTVDEGNTWCDQGLATCKATMSKLITYQFAVGSRSPARPATAKWLQLRSGVISPVTVGTCSFSNPPLNTLMMLWTFTGCNGQPSAEKGWIQDGCTLQSVGSTLPGSTGNSTSCDSDLNAAFLSPGQQPKDLLLPVWSSYSGGYVITTIMRFRVYGWSAQGSQRSNLTMSDRCTADPAKFGTGYLKVNPGDSNKPCIFGMILGYGVEVGGTTGAPCLSDTLHSACYVALSN